MSFSDHQKTLLSSKLRRRHVKTREVNGFMLSYIEGWHAIAEANRIFGFDGWDRETLEVRCIWSNDDRGQYDCVYAARVRVTVKANPNLVVREGSGAGSARAGSAVEAHEHAIKEAETDAMKRALATFGNPFGLALYDKEQRNVTKHRIRNGLVELVIVDVEGKRGERTRDPKAFCSKLKRLLISASSDDGLIKIWDENQSAVSQLRENFPSLSNDKGGHYSDLLRKIFEEKLRAFGSTSQTISRPDSSKGTKAFSNADMASLCNNPQSANENTNTLAEMRGSTLSVLNKGPLRLRDPDHLKRIRSMACLVCGRSPSQAHHLTFAQPKAMGRKAGDQYTVPLCAVHHRDLHHFGDERKWWSEKSGIDPMDWINANA